MRFHDEPRATGRVTSLAGSHSSTGWPFLRTVSLKHEFILRVALIKDIPGLPEAHAGHANEGEGPRWHEPLVGLISNYGQG